MNHFTNTPFTRCPPLKIIPHKKQMIISLSSEDWSPHQEPEETTQKVVFCLISMVPGHLIQLQCSRLGLGPWVGLSKGAISSPSSRRSFIVISSFSQSLDDCNWSLFLVQKFWAFSHIFKISVVVEKSSLLVSISIEKLLVFEFR